jgi:hypothetical protein
MYNTNLLLNPNNIIEEFTRYNIISLIDIKA